MKKVKIAFWVILIAFFVLIVYQNQEFFMAKQSLKIDLALQTYYTPDTQNAVICAAFFLLGFLIAYISGLTERFRSGKTIKGLNATNQTHREQVALLKKEVDALKGASAPSPAPTGETDEKATEEATAQNA